MTDFTLHTVDSAPQEAKPLLQKSQQAFGMIPNLHAVMAQAPALLENYQTAHELFTQTSFNEEELTVVWQSINVEHECHYCVPAHTAIAKQMGVDDAIVDAIRDGKPLNDSKLETLRQTTLELVRERGRLSNEQRDAFFAAGYGNQQLLEIVLGISQKVMSNYVNHLADTPVDEPFRKFVQTEKAA